MINRGRGADGRTVNQLDSGRALGLILAMENEGRISELFSQRLSRPGSHRFGVIFRRRQGRAFMF